MPVLTFRAEYLKPALAGEKTSTTRTAATLPPRTAPGETLTMQFGRRDKPTTLSSTITAVEECRYMEWYEALAEGDPRQDMEPPELHAVLLAGTPAERRLVEVAQTLGNTVEDMLDLLISERRRLVYVVHWRDVQRR